MMPVLQPDLPVIGIVGGMGSYATLHLFRVLLDAFPAEKEWDRPRVLIDNNCSMPSRVRAVLYGERRDEVIESLAGSSRQLVLSGANCLYWACNTSHCFLPEVRDIYPEIDRVFVDALRLTATACAEQGVTSACVLATEGTIVSRVYSTYLESSGITAHYPGEAEFPLLRKYIEAVKQNRVVEVASEFGDYVSRKCDAFGHVVLGCTELSVFARQFNGSFSVIDPISLFVQHATGRWMSALRMGSADTTGGGR